MQIKYDALLKTTQLYIKWITRSTAQQWRGAATTNKSTWTDSFNDSTQTTSSLPKPLLGSYKNTCLSAVLLSLNVKAFSWQLMYLKLFSPQNEWTERAAPEGNTSMRLREDRPVKPARYTTTHTNTPALSRSQSSSLTLTQHCVNINFVNHLIRSVILLSSTDHRSKHQGGGKLLTVRNRKRYLFSESKHTRECPNRYLTTLCTFYWN